MLQFNQLLSDDEKISKKFAQQNPLGVKYLFDKYQREIGKQNGTNFLKYNGIEDDTLPKSDDTDKKIIKPCSHDNVHFRFNLKIPNYPKPITIDTFYGTLELPKDAVISLPIIPDVSSKTGYLRFQSSKNECWLMGAKIAKILSFVPNNILQECIISGQQKDLFIKFGYQKFSGAIVFDWKKLHEEMPEILPHIFSFCQSKRYMAKFCALLDINLEEITKFQFTKITNQKNLKKANKKIILEDLLEKYKDKDGKNYRPQHHADKILKI